MKLPLGQTTVVARRFINLKDEIQVAILQTIKAGWRIALLRVEVKPDADEIVITECLRDAMRVALEQQGFPWSDSIIVAPGTESRSVAGMTVPDGRTDIPLYLTPLFRQPAEHDPHVIIECKRVAHGNAALARLYVIGGINRFSNSQYAENHATGFMIGYVVNGNGTQAVQGINKFLLGRSRNTEILAVSQYTTLLDTWESSHPRLDGRSNITLIHAMLAVN